ncbi:MAG: hypothetical protein ACKO69_06915 [Limnohabitans sp.]
MTEKNSTSATVMTLEDLCVWIDAHLKEPIGWTELMQVSGMDHQSLQNEFIRKKNMTPMTWIRKRREEATASVAPSASLKVPYLLIS